MIGIQTNEQRKTKHLEALETNHVIFYTLYKLHFQQINYGFL